MVGYVVESDRSKLGVEKAIQKSLRQETKVKLTWSFLVCKRIGELGRTKSLSSLELDLKRK